MKVRAKFKVASSGSGVVTLYPVVSGSPENEAFFKMTPGGSLSLSTVNDAVIEALPVGKEFYVDLTPAD